MTPLAMTALELDPSLVMEAIGFADPLPWQRALLRSTSDKVLLNAHRQAGKSQATSALAVWTALFDPGSLILIVSASQRQSNELFDKVKATYQALGSPIPASEDNAVTLRLSNASRIVSLPDSIDTIIGYSAPRLIIIDEAARVKDETYYGLRPMLARSRGAMVALSTPRGKRGWWYEAWNDHEATWTRIEYPVTENPHIDIDWLAEEKRLLGPRWFAQEYLCSFEETEDAFLPAEAIDAAFCSDRPPLFSTEYFS
jgi:hypothetical protein